jgi:adenylate cyclase
MERRLAAILAADVVGYTRLMRADEAGTLQRLTGLREGVLEPLIAEHTGRVVKLMGDGLLVEFASLVDAVGCAVAWQMAVDEHEAEQPEDDRFSFRIGVNLGDVLVEGEDIHGDGVNIAARLEGLAEPGGICLSGDAYRQVRGKIEVEFEDLGEREVKNLAEPLRVYRIAIEGPSLVHSPAATRPLPLPDKPSIAVLPFDNMSGDPEQEYFADGITEDIITDLSKVSGLFVIARNSAFVYKDKAVNVPEVCRELGVRFALEGSIRKAGNRVRITAQLVDGSSGGHLWAERYDRDLTDIFEVQDDVTQQIVAALKVTLSEAERSLIVDGGTKNVAAHDFFLRGRELLLGPKRDREMFDRATACFRRAVEIDPNYAAPYAGLSMAYALDHHNRWSKAPETSLDQAEHFAGEAIAKDDKDPFAHFVTATVAMFKKDHERWTDAADRALSFNPNYALALNIRGMVHIYTGEPAKATPYIERAMRLDPAFQQLYLHFLGLASFVAGDYETAADLFRDRIAVNPTTDMSRAFLASALGHLGHMDEARRTWRELKEVNPGYSHLDHIGRLPFRDPADAKKVTEGLCKAGLPD